MITTSAWVRRGVAAQFPTKYEIDEEEMDRISKLARMQLEDAREDLTEAQERAKDDDVKEDDAMDEDDKKDDKKPTEAKKT
jgi:periodic tryptophan protein 1